MSDWEVSSALDRNEPESRAHWYPKALLALIPSGGKEVSQERLKLLKVQYPHLRRCWRGLLELKVNLMQLIITDNYVLNSTTLGLIIYQM